MSAEDREPIGQAYGWYQDVLWYVPASHKGTAHAVAFQIARLCGEDSQVSHLTWRSLADAVAERDGLGRRLAFVQSGVKVLEDHGWLERETRGQKRGAVTTWRLMVGPAGPRRRARGGLADLCTEVRPRLAEAGEAVSDTDP